GLRGGGCRAGHGVAAGLTPCRGGTGGPASPVPSPRSPAPIEDSPDARLPHEHPGSDTGPPRRPPPPLPEAAPARLRGDPASRYPHCEVICVITVPESDRIGQVRLVSWSSRHSRPRSPRPAGDVARVRARPPGGPPACRGRVVRHRVTVGPPPPSPRIGG